MNLTRRNSISRLHTLVIEFILVRDMFLDGGQSELFHSVVLLNIQGVLVLTPAWIKYNLKVDQGVVLARVHYCLILEFSEVGQTMPRKVSRG